MEDRLLPVNGLLGLAIQSDVNQAVLHEAGFRVEGLEVPVSSSVGNVVIDVVLFHPKSSMLVLCEAKSGANVEVDQASKYAALNPTDVVYAANVTLDQRVPPVAVTLYVCLSQHMDRIRQGLVEAKAEFPVVGVAQDAITFDCPESTPAPLGPALRRSRLDLVGPPPRMIEFDQDSPVEVIEPSVRAQLVAALTHQRQQVSVPWLAEGAARYLSMYGRKARNQLIRRVGEAARKIAEADQATFEYHGPGANDPGYVRLLKSPEQNDPRGRTQAYQALARRRPVRRRSQQVDPDQLDLLRELEGADDGSADDREDDGEVTP